MTARKKILTAATVALLVSLVAAFLCRQPLTRKLVDWRIEKNLAAYREAADVGDWRSAHRYALSAHQLNPLLLETLLALLEIGVADKTVHRGNLAATAVRIVHHPNADATDKARALKVFLDAGDGVVFFRLFEKLSEAEQRQPEVLQLYATYLASIGEIGNSVHILEALLARSEGDDHLLALQLARVLSTSVVGNPGVGNRIQQLVMQLLNHPDRSVGLRALGLLQGVPAEQWKCGELLKAADWVAQHDEASVADHLIIVSLRIQKDPDQRGVLIEQAKSRFGLASPMVVARWLAVHREFDLALAVLNEEIAERTPEGFIARARILHQSGRPADAERWLQKPHNGVPASVVSTLRAVVARDGEKDRWWQKALQQAELEAGGGTGAFWRISGSAAAVGNREIEMRAATEALKRRGPHPSVSELGPVFAWLYENDRVEDLRQVFRVLIRREPESAMLRNNLAYLDVISGRNDDGLMVELQALHDRFPEVSEFAASLAVAELERGNYQKARSLLEANIDDWSSAPTSTLAAYAVVRGHTGRETSQGIAPEKPFDGLLARIKWSEMLETEREFFQSRWSETSLSSSEAPRETGEH